MIKIIRFPRYSFNSHFIAKRKFSYFSLIKKFRFNLPNSTLVHSVTIDTSFLVVKYQIKSCNIRMSSRTSTSDYFRLTDYDSIGFDLDNTLVRYDIKNMMELEYNVLAKFLVTQKGYSSEFLYKPIDNGELDIVQKGLILDVKRGNILRLAPNGYIQKAAHGSRLLSNEEIIVYYGNERKWQPTTQFCEDFLSAWNGPLSDCFRTVLDYFDMPAALIFSRIIDTIDKNEIVAEYDVWPDILDGLVVMFARENFLSTKSEYFVAMRKNPAKYILKTNDKVINWLKELKRYKPLFLLTGSHIDFADLTASYALGRDWRDLFDVIVCYAKKPGFFVNNRSFYSLNGSVEGAAITKNDLKLNGIYCQGNWGDLIYVLNQKSDIDPNKILYVGDNLIQDIYTPRKNGAGDTIAICEEMEGEDSIPKQYYHMHYDTIRSNFWGSYFHNDNHDATIWSTLIKTYSKICVPNVDILAQHPINYPYKCFKNNDSNEGFHPIELSKI